MLEIDLSRNPNARLCNYWVENKLKRLSGAQMIKSITVDVFPADL